MGAWAPGCLGSPGGGGKCGCGRSPWLLSFPLWNELPTLPTASPFLLPLLPPALEKKAAAHPNDGAVEHAGLHGLWGREKGGRQRAEHMPAKPGTQPLPPRPSPPRWAPLLHLPVLLPTHPSARVPLPEPTAASRPPGLLRKGRLPFPSTGSLCAFRAWPLLK